MKKVKNKTLTSQYRTRAIVYTTISWVLVWVIAAVLMICGISMTAGNPALVETLGTVLYGFGVSLLPVAALAIIVKDRIKPTLWMINIILTAYIFSTGAMYVCAVIWAIDTYIISFLAKRNRNLYTINHEIDKRNC